MFKFKSQIETIDHCVICKTSQIEFDEKFARSLGLIEPYKVRFCRSCGLRWLSPRPDSEGYDQLYSYETYFEGPVAVEHYPEVGKERGYYFRERIKKIERCFPSDTKLSMLDVGAATGEFTNEANKRGHTCLGIEISDGARKKAMDDYGTELSGQSLEEVDNENGFDVIHMNHVFEHLPYPDQALDVCHKLLKPSGLLVLEVPQQFYNDLDYLKKLLGKNKKPEFNTYSLHHTYFFNTIAIGKLLEKHGFSVYKLTTSNPAKTPLVPFSFTNLLLRGYLWMVDKIHRGGNIIEIYAISKK